MRTGGCRTWVILCRWVQEHPERRSDQTVPSTEAEHGEPYSFRRFGFHTGVDNSKAMQCYSSHDHVASRLSNAPCNQTKPAQLVLTALRCSQAVASGCQVIVLEESMPDCPAAASFAATAALSGYALTVVSSLPSFTSIRQCVLAYGRWSASECVTMQVTGSGKHDEAGMQRRLTQQGSGTSTCKLLCMRPGQEALLAAVVLAPILFRETILGQPQQHSAGSVDSSHSVCGTAAQIFVIMWSLNCYVVIAKRL